MIKNIIIVAILLILLFFMLMDPKPSEGRVITKIDTLVQLKEYTKYEKGKNIYHKVLDTIYRLDKVQIHDTAFIIKDYNQVVAYSDTIKRDSNIFIINDTISQNKIQSRGFKSTIAEKTITITKDIYHKSKNEFYLGLVGDVRRIDNKVAVGVGMMYKKQKEVYTFSITANQFNIGLYKKLF
jgi:hypothetical protein